jgi:hypothetical protein
MGLETLTQLELIQLNSSLIYVVVSLAVGFKILIHHFTIKNKTFITVGLKWMFLSTPWLGYAISILPKMYPSVSLIGEYVLGVLFTDR